MWKKLPLEEKQEYKKMILAFASLTEMFAQKAETDTDDETNVLLSPIINSKYQETIFQKVFHASAEDIGNTSYDASIEHEDAGGSITKYLIGIKTFGIASGAQKVAQFKANHNDWADIINQIQRNSINANGERYSKTEINQANNALYQDLAEKIASLRNQRIESSKANILGFKDPIPFDTVESVYHVLMPSKGETPAIHVGETGYDKINIDALEILGCTSAKNPTNFSFSDGNHTYRYTSADSQLYMEFNNSDIVEESWDVKYAKDAYEIFSQIAEKVYNEPEQPQPESYSWLLTNKKGEVELFSGFNSFYGVGSKLSKGQRAKVPQKIRDKYQDIVSDSALKTSVEYIKNYLDMYPSTDQEKREKAAYRQEITAFIKSIGNKDFEADALKSIYRPADEMYIPIPNSKEFHIAHPDFFAPDAGKFNADGKTLSASKENRKFTLVFEPSGNELPMFITQDNGKAIESYEKQSILGQWLLEKVFILNKYEPLTAKRLAEIGINGIRLAKYPNSEKIHLSFIWIDTDNPPRDYIR